MWIIKNVKNKDNSNTVILARNNKSLFNIECILIKNKIPFIKVNTISLLDKYHVKDFIAFINIINNPKSSIFWKRIISLHKGFDIVKANELIESSIYENISILNKINLCIELIELTNILTKINKIDDPKNQSKVILDYLETLWIENKRNNISEMKNDISNLLYYLRNSNLKEFINNLYLNETETHEENILQLSTIHSSKGLEWDKVFIIDVNNKDFPNIQNKNYKEQLLLMEEERRLFYVGCSRAKKLLTITYHKDSNTSMSPFIKELNPELYTAQNVVIENINLSNYITLNIINFLKNIGYKNISKILENLNIKEKNLIKNIIVPSQLKNKNIIMVFLNCLISKIIQNNFPTKIKNFNLNIVNKYNNFPKKIYYEYIDNNTHWKNQLENIFYIATYNINSDFVDLEPYKDFLLKYNYLEFENGIIKLVELFKPKTIINNYNISYELLKANIDLLFDDIIIEIKISSSEICNIENICQVLTYGYLLFKKEKKINKIVLYNIESGNIYTIDTSNFDFLLFYNLLFLQE
jgi:hypothetical protein